jgi:hypothetical protein
MEMNISTLDIILANLLTIVNSRYNNILLILGQTIKKKLKIKDLFEKINQMEKIKKSTFKYRLNRLKSIGILIETGDDFIELLNKGQFLFQFILNLYSSVSPLKRDPFSIILFDKMKENEDIEINTYSSYPTQLVKRKFKKFLKSGWIKTILNLPRSKIYRITETGIKLKKHLNEFKKNIKSIIQFNKTQFIIIDWEIAIGFKYRRINEIFIIGTAIKSIYQQESNDLLLKEFNLSKYLFNSIKKEFKKMEWIKKDKENIIPTEKGQIYFNKLIVNDE